MLSRNSSAVATSMPREGLTAGAINTASGHHRGGRKALAAPPVSWSLVPLGNYCSEAGFGPRAVPAEVAQMVLDLLCGIEIKRSSPVKELASLMLQSCLMLDLPPAAGCRPRSPRLASRASTTQDCTVSCVSPQKHARPVPAQFLSHLPKGGVGFPAMPPTPPAFHVCPLQCTGCPKQAAIYNKVTCTA